MSTLTSEEQQRLLSLLGRPANVIEQQLVGAMWSEHCSYKSSKRFLKNLPTTGPHVIEGPGENAGVVDIGGGFVAVFKIESHNHPSFIEPYQGAATGVGGILRDIFAMGARPVALLNSLRFGPPDTDHTQYLIKRVVAGIADYGNCIGVPTVGGEIYFSSIYAKNPLVNVFCLGIARRESIIKAAASNPGNAVLYVGSPTGRDGIHGATMASQALGKTDPARHTVQVGDPFCGKRLMEACLEVIQTGHVQGMQDMGAAGLISSSSEMAHRGGRGIEIDVASVPRRERTMTPDEIMLSESQERMLLVIHPDHLTPVREVFSKWDIPTAVIGHVTEATQLTVKDNEKIVAEIPIAVLTSEAPVYDRPSATPRFQEILQSVAWEAVPQPKSYAEALLTLLSSPHLASKAWVYQQYDHMVGARTVIAPGYGAAVLRIEDAGVSLACTVDGNATYCLLNPYYGGMIAVAEAARNLIGVGALPLALSDGLNFGNPEHSEVMWQFSLCLEGIRDACLQFEIPIVSGNVSFYNETHGIDIYPTPIVAMVGKVDSPLHPGWKSAGEFIILIGETLEELGGSAYFHTLHAQERGFPPMLNLEKEKAVQKAVLDAITSGVITAAQDCAEGGVSVALAEGCLHSPYGIGASVRIDPGPLRTDAVLFGESQSRFVVTAKKDQYAYLTHLLDTAAVPHTLIGETGGTHLEISGTEITYLRLSLDEIRAAYHSPLSV